MELSKKNRELTAELESERSKVRQLAKKSQEMEKEVIILIYLFQIIGDPHSFESCLSSSEKKFCAVHHFPVQTREFHVFIYII